MSIFSVEEVTSCTKAVHSTHINMVNCTDLVKSWPGLNWDTKLLTTPIIVIFLVFHSPSCSMYDLETPGDEEEVVEAVPLTLEAS